MVDQAIEAPPLDLPSEAERKSDSKPEAPKIPSGKIIATGVSADEYMEKYAEQRAEWVRGYVIQMSPATIKHKLLIGYLYELLRTYLTLSKIGRLIAENFVMRLDAIEVRREPDIMIVLGDADVRIKETYVDGPADICIEVVSPESGARDYGDKFTEYENGGVREYWIFDPFREEHRFFQRNEEGVFKLVLADDDGNYTSPLLPGLVIHVPTLWEGELPDILQTVEAVKKMLDK